jgi:excisionase family DNA binding protein
MSRHHPKKLHGTAAPATVVTSTPTTPHFVSVACAASMLAVSQKTVRRAITDDRLQATRLGRRVLISQGALQQFLTNLIVASVASPKLHRKP